ncbi:hypothetical protein BU16DRAFT_326887 [Lophium mytilinum]|uniref:Uncharacterized protein n=1 Tax=Lophium mytilinum TaxID=390894 RepID=A0A6A6R379_9PEZI|nr:hypothetical protein BU16DRAFT_326887 [Lophium mytilinum]
MKPILSSLAASARAAGAGAPRSHLASRRSTKQPHERKFDQEETTIELPKWREEKPTYPGHGVVPNPSLWPRHIIYHRSPQFRSDLRFVRSVCHAVSASRCGGRAGAREGLFSWLNPASGMLRVRCKWGPKLLRSLHVWGYWAFEKFERRRNELGIISISSARGPSHPAIAKAEPTPLIRATRHKKHRRPPCLIHQIEHRVQRQLTPFLCLTYVTNQHSSE